MRYPFTYMLYVAIAFVFGVALAFLFMNVSFIFVAFILCFIFLILAVAIMFLKIKILNPKIAFNMAISLIFLSTLLAAYAYTCTRYFNAFKNPLNKIETDILAFEASIIDYDGLFGTRERYVANVTRVFDGTNWSRRHGRIRLYSQSRYNFQIRDSIVVNAKINLYKNIFTNALDADDSIISALEQKMLYGVASIYNNHNVFIEKSGFSIKNYASLYAKPLRMRIKESLSKYLNPINYSIAQCLVVGDRSILPSDVQDIFREAGISHLLAVSGLHLSMILLVISMILSIMRVGFYKRIIIATLLTVIIYLPITLYSVSVVRAGIMAMMLMLTLLFDRSRNTINALSITVLIILLIEPNSLREVSFQFSALATLGIILFFSSYRVATLEKIRDKKIFAFGLKYIIDSLILSMSAILITLPLSVHYFSVLNLKGLLSNLFAIPLSFLILFTSLITIVTENVFAATTLDLLVELLLFLSKQVSYIKILSYDVNISFFVALILTTVITTIGFLLYKKTLKVKI